MKGNPINPMVSKAVVRGFGATCGFHEQRQLWSIAVLTVMTLWMMVVAGDGADEGDSKILLGAMVVGTMVLLWVTQGLRRWQCL